MKKQVRITSFAVKAVGDECDLSFVPPMTRRRFSPLQKVVFSLLGRVAPKGCEPKIVFASAGGEVKLTHDLVESFNSDGEVSPWKFSSSVYNAAPGLYSVFAGNHSTYTALAAGEETIEASLAEAVFEPGGAVWCCAEEADGGYGFAVGFEDSRLDDARQDVMETGPGNAAGAALAFSDVVDLLHGRTGEIVGRRISLKRIG